MPMKNAKKKYDEKVDRNINFIKTGKLDKCIDPDNRTTYFEQCEGIDILMAQDGLCSLKMIDQFSSNKLIDYILFRHNMFGTLVWPAYAISINQLRRASLQDRVDLLLIDLKRFYSIVNKDTNLTVDIVKQIWANCKLARAYVFPNTYYWLRSFGSFQAFIIERNLKAFIGEDGEPYKWTDNEKFDLEYYNILVQKVKYYKEEKDTNGRE